MPGPGTAVGKGVRHSLEQIEKVHRIPEGMPTVPVKTSTARGYYGVYKFDRLKSLPTEIRVRTTGDHIAGTFTHEFGHYLDHQGNLSGASAAGRAVFGSSPVGRKEPLMQAFFDAVEASPTKQTLNAVAKAPGARINGAATYNSNVEVWARAYHQWIATRSGSPVMRAEIAAIRANRGPGQVRGFSQWDDDEFEPIAAALDAIFRAKGLLR